MDIQISAASPFPNFYSGKSYVKKSHACVEAGVQLRISVWHLLMNLKNNLLKKFVIKKIIKKNC